MDKPGDAATDERIERLERDCRRLIALVVLTVIGALVLVVDGSGLLRRNRTIEAQALELRDKNGTVRARLGLRPNGSPELQFLDTRGRDQIILEAQEDDMASLTFYNKGEQSANLMSTGDGTTYLKFLNSEGEESLSLYHYPREETGLVFNSNARAISMVLKADGTPKLWVSEPRVDAGQSVSLTPSNPFRLAP
jgi:hypothetical protein